MQGRGIGTLHMYRVTDESGDGSVYVKKEIWSASKDHGRAWFSAHVNINASKLFRIEFTAVRGVTYQSDIAIDDITFGKCTMGRIGEF